MNWFQYLMWLASKVGRSGPAVPSAPQPKPAPVPGSVFDDFNGPAGSTPDTTLWSIPTSANHPDTKQGVDIATADNTYLDGNSNLVIRSELVNGQWTTGWLASWGHPPYRYGKFSASIKMPPGTGKDSGFWMLGQLYDQGTPEPGCGEIDIIEYIGDGKYYSTIHGPMYGGAPWNQTQLNGTLQFDPSADFHTYWCDHQPGSVLFGVDGTTVGAANHNTIPGGAPWVLDQPFDVLFCTNVGNSMSGAPTAATPSPMEMLVDWFYFEPSS